MDYRLIFETFFPRHQKFIFDAFAPIFTTFPDQPELRPTPGQFAAAFQLYFYGYGKFFCGFRHKLSPENGYEKENLSYA
jgi:hypothetical protein